MNPSNVGTFHGRLGQDPDLKEIGDMKVARFSLAIRRNIKEKSTQEYGTDWVRLVAYGRSAEAAKNLLRKGDMIIATFHVRTKSDKNKEGKNVEYIDFVLDDFNKIFTTPKGQTAAEPAAEATPAAASGEVVEEIPF